MSDSHLRVGKPKSDPLTQGEEAGRVLFDRINLACRDFPYEAVVNAAGNLLLNVLRQRNKTRDQASRDFDEMFGRLKSILMAHYDVVSGSRRSIFPFHQTIEMPFMDFRKTNGRSE